MKKAAFQVLLLVIFSSEFVHAQWQSLTNTAPTNIGAVLLLTDGTVVGHEEPDTVQSLATVNWYRLTPDMNGSYVNGTWSQIATLPSNYCPLFFASAVLPDARLLVEGGEDNTCDMQHESFTNQGAIYDPLANSWTPVNPPSGWAAIGDAPAAVLANGTYMQGAYSNPDALLDASTLTWTITGTGKFDPDQEEGWTLLPNGNVLTVDTYHTIPQPGTNSEIYNPSTGAWTSAGSTIVQLWDSCNVKGVGVTHEIGPAVLQPNGKVFAMGGNACGAGNTATYDPVAQTWTPGPEFPDSLNIDDGPAALEINGKVLMMTSPGLFNPPSTFLEWDGSELTQVEGPPNAPADTSYQGHMLMLPTGQILFTDYSTDVEILTSTGSPYSGWTPEVTLPSALPTFTRGSTVVLQGYNFNGASQNNAYGDDFQDATNYPIVRFTNVSTGHVFYGRTHDHSSMAVGYTGPTSTHVDIPASMETGSANMQVVVNGIASQNYRVVIR